MELPLDPDALGAPRIVDAEGIQLRQIHQDAQRVVSRLTSNGHEAYLVGGCVRDLLLGRAPKDFDVATSAHPRHIRALFRNARIIGRRFKLAHVVYGQHVIETATFRSKPPPEDEEGGDLLIREDNVFGTAAEDARRRDFTINGLFLDPLNMRILDYVGGLEDLNKRVLCTIGDPRVRMAEDPVRILRAIKFATRLGLRIDDATWDAMCEHAPVLERSAPPRVFEEILRLLRSGTALGAFRMMRACGALKVLMPAIEVFLGTRDDPDPKAHDRADHYWRLLEALDADVHAGREPSRALCLAVTYLRVIEFRIDPERGALPDSPGEVFVLTGEVLEPIAAAARLPRRDCALARRMIADQARLSEARIRQAKPPAFLFHPDFPEALNLFRLRMAAWGQGWDVYEAWAERHKSTQELAPEERAVLKGRRRRGRRSRRGNSGAAPA